MKKITLIIAIIAVSFIATDSKSQVRFNVQVNVGHPVCVVRQASNCEFYYYPEIGIYYNPYNAEFIFWDCNRWVVARNLPNAYYGYDFNGGYRVSVYGENPWYRDNYYRNQYEGYRTAYYNRQREYREREYRDRAHYEREHAYAYHAPYRREGYENHGYGGYYDNHRRH